jgi:hypothetical protein
MGSDRVGIGRTAISCAKRRRLRNVLARVRAMKVKDLIASLKKCKPDSEVVCFVSWDDRVIRINSVDSHGAEGNVVLSDSFPKAELESSDGRK